MTLYCGDKITIDGIDMTCTSVNQNCGFESYHVLWFSNGDLHEAQANMLSASTVLDCEIAEVYDAIEKGDKEEAIEECYDAIAVLLRLIDVLSDDQPLGKPAPETSGDEGKPTPRIFCQSCGKETLLKEGDDRRFCPCCHSSRVRFTDAPLPPPKSSAAPETERKGKTADGNYEYPPIDPDYGTMRCCCPFRKGAADAH